MPNPLMPMCVICGYRVSLCRRSYMTRLLLNSRPDTPNSSRSSSSPGRRTPYRARERTQRDDHVPVACSVVDDFMVPADIVRVGLGDAVDVEAKYEILIVQVRGIGGILPDKIRIRKRGNAVFGHAAADHKIHGKTRDVQEVLRRQRRGPVGLALPPVPAGGAGAEGFFPPQAANAPAIRNGCAKWRRRIISCRYDDGMVSANARDVERVQRTILQ